MRNLLILLGLLGMMMTVGCGESSPEPVDQENASKCAYDCNAGVAECFICHL